MRTFCITLPYDNPPRTEKARRHFEEMGVGHVIFYTGIHAETFGISTNKPYNLDRKPEDGDFFMGPKPTGIYLSHYGLWACLETHDDDMFLILEDDAKFTSNWQNQFRQIMSDVPKDFDVIYFGSCCTGGRVVGHVKGNIYDVRYPMCTHAYVVTKKAIKKLLETQRNCYGPIDITMTLHTFEQLKVYTVLPRIVDQFDTEIPE